MVAFAKSGERLVGQAAKRQAVTNPENTLFVRGQAPDRSPLRRPDGAEGEGTRPRYKIIRADSGDACGSR